MARELRRHDMVGSMRRGRCPAQRAHGELLVAPLNEPAHPAAVDDPTGDSPRDRRLDEAKV